MKQVGNNVARIACAVSTASGRGQSSWINAANHSQTGRGDKTPTALSSTRKDAMSGRSSATLIATPPPNECPISITGSSMPTSFMNDSTHRAYPSRLRSEAGRSAVPPSEGRDGAYTRHPRLVKRLMALL